ncbi:MAG: molybdopterin biosynthesis protein, partial [Nitrospinaceae bacterium]|nr:molybdopterin biosynthesis protein [Nitrospinaceae bacterium]
VVVVNFVQREQGILLPPGNPKGITSVADLARDDVTIVNRQSGAGTRVLLDHLLDGAKISTADVAGYGSVETTHVAVAMAVAGARADAGLGIYAAAKLLGLEFVSLGWERFDFIFPAEYWETPLIKKLIEVLREPAFAASVEALGGYKTDLTGQVMTPPENV